ncbi:MAG: hypothetical protein V3R65_02115 [Acidiferrobacterales bacterium]
MKTADKQSQLRKAFWSGTFPYRKWAAIIRARDFSSHGATLKSSFQYLPVDWLLNEFKPQRFIRKWPELRTLFDPAVAMEKSRLQIWDTLWALLTTGDSQYPVSPAVAELGAKRRAFLREVIAHPGITTYELSRKHRRDYSRTYKDQRLLVDKGLLRIHEDKRNGRKIHRLYASDSVNTVLASL